MEFLKKIAQTIEMSIAIPDSEIGIANVLISNLEKLSKKYDSFNTLLDTMYNPFADAESIPEESIKKNKKPLFDFKKQLEEKMKEIEGIAILCVKDLNEFSSDTDINELLQTFKENITEIKDNMRVLGDVLVSWDADDYKDMVVKAIENIKKNINNSRELINDRIIKHINENVLNKSWVEDVGKDFSVEIKNKEPYIKELYKEREKQLQGLGF